MRFLADESCDFAVVRALRGAGHDVVAVSDAYPGALDEEVIALAAKDARILLTEDKDFGQLVFASAAGSAGVVFLRFPASARSDMAHTVVEAIATHGPRIAGCFAVLQPGRIRIVPRPREP